MNEPTAPPTPHAPDPNGEPQHDPEESGAASTTTTPSTTSAATASTPGVGTPEATDAAVAALAAARAAELAPQPPVIEAVAADAAATAPPAPDPAATAPTETVPADTVPAEAVPADAAPVDAALAATAFGDPPPAAAPAATAPAATAPAAAPAATAGSGRRAGARRILRNFAVLVLTVGLFIGGIAIGTALFQNTRAAPIGGPAVVESNDGPPPVAQEFISALAANDADALRSSLDQEPHLDLTREMTKFGIQRVDNVEVLGTHIDGNRSATEILMQYESTDGTPFAINLVILVDGGKIEGFR